MRRKGQAQPQRRGSVHVRGISVQVHIDDKRPWSAILSTCVKRSCLQECSSKNDMRSHSPSSEFHQTWSTVLPSPVLLRICLRLCKESVEDGAIKISAVQNHRPNSFGVVNVLQRHPGTIVESVKADCGVSTSPTSSFHYFGNT